MKVAQEEMVKVGRTAIDIAWKGLDGKEATALAIDSGSRYTNGHLLLPFFETRLTIDLDRKLVLLGGKMADETTSILALHYLAGWDQMSQEECSCPSTRQMVARLIMKHSSDAPIDRLAIEFGGQPNSLIGAGEPSEGSISHWDRPRRGQGFPQGGGHVDSLGRG
jgi:hypothetical protein